MIKMQRPSIHIVGYSNIRDVELGYTYTQGDTLTVT